jgi:F-type H+-transporting ATPase subunit alpha
LKKYETELARFIENRHPDIFTDIRTKRELTDELKNKINVALKEFNETFTV